VGFYYGIVGNSEKTCSYYVRCVRGDSDVTTSYTDNGDGTIADSITGLTWQQGEGGSKTWESALTYCEGLTLGGQSDWRLPNFKELQSIADYARYSPAINKTYFPNAYSSNYWSSTTYANYTYYAWGVDFNGGDVGYYGKTGNRGYVRCVRGGQ